MKLPANFTSFYSSLDAVKRLVLDRHSQIVDYEKGAIVFEKGTPPDAAYTIEKGVVEIFLPASDGLSERSVAYLSRGDLFGEMGVVTGKPRIATIRACENVSLRKFPQEQFLKLVERVPSFGIFLAINMAERLYRATAEHYFMSYCVDFSGNTENFDLLIIFQTLQSSARTGELQLTNTNNDIVGSFFFQDGNVERARFMHLQGIEAVWQLFLEEKLLGSFAFQITRKPTFKQDESHHIRLSGMDLLMQAASKRDTYQRIRVTEEQMNTFIRRTADEFSWEGEENREVAETIWQHLQKRSQTLGTIWRLSNFSIMTLIEAMVPMRERGLVDWAA